MTHDAALAEQLDAIAYPGHIAALGCTLIDWTVHGPAYARTMVETAQVLARELAALGLPVHAIERGGTRSHQLALQARSLGGGQAAAPRLGAAGLLCCGIGLPIAEVEGDLSGLRLGTPEIVRLGLTPADMPRLAELIARGLPDADPVALRAKVAAWRRTLGALRYVL